jgi:hypothetical protein
MTPATAAAAARASRARRSAFTRRTLAKPAHHRRVSVSGCGFRCFDTDTWSATGGSWRCQVAGQLPGTASIRYALVGRTNAMAASTSRLVGACSSSPGTYADPGVIARESTRPLRPTRRRRSSSASSMESTIIRCPFACQTTPGGLWTTRRETLCISRARTVQNYRVRRVGLRGVEPRTSALSVLRSNQLSYSPGISGATLHGGAEGPSRAFGRRSRPRRRQRHR